MLLVVSMRLKKNNKLSLKQISNEIESNKVGCELSCIIELTTIASLYFHVVGQSYSTAKDLKLIMRYGRKDCYGNPAAKKELFPKAHWGHEKIMEWCDEQFGFTNRECVAFMGV